MEDKLGPNYVSKLAKITFMDQSSEHEVITEKRTYFPSGQPTTAAGISSNIVRDLYISLGDNLQTDIWSFKVQIKPFIRWIWVGSIMIALGTLIAGIKQIRRS